MSRKLKPGDKAPDFELFDQNLNHFRLSELQGRKHVVLFFYPKDDTRVCTREACSFRDNITRFKDRDVEVVGISGDSIHSHQRFAIRNRLPYRILSDEDGVVRKLYGITKILGLVSRRETFIINKEGVIVNIVSDMLNGEAHVEEALEALSGLN